MVAQQDRYRFTRDIAASLIRYQREKNRDPSTPSPLNSWVVQLTKKFNAGEASAILNEAQDEALEMLERHGLRATSNFVRESTRESYLKRWKNWFH